MNLNINNDQFSDLIARAKRGDAVPLNAFLKQLYQKGKLGLLGLTSSEADAEEYFATAVARFWEKFVAGNAALPETNIGGYIYTIAKFLYLDQKRTTAKKQVATPVDPVLENRKELAETPRTAADFEEEEKREHLRKEAMQRAMAKLGENCRRLFYVIMEKGLEKPRELFTILGLEDARAVTVIRYECTKQLKVKAAFELRLLMQERR